MVPFSNNEKLKKAHCVLHILYKHRRKSCYIQKIQSKFIGLNRHQKKESGFKVECKPGFLTHSLQLYQFGVLSVFTIKIVNAISIKLQASYYI